MRKALENVKNRKSTANQKATPILINSGFEITPSHFYVEFQPETEAEEAL